MRSLVNLFPFLSNYKWKLGFSILFNLLTAVFTLISIPFIIPFFQILFDVNITSYKAPANYQDLEAVLNYSFSRLIAISDRRTALYFVCIMLIVIVLLRNVFRYLSTFYLIPVRNGLVRDLRAQLTESFYELPISYVKKKGRGELLSIASNDVIEVEWSVIRMLELLFKSPIIIIGSLGFMFWINAKLSLIAIALLLVVAVILGGLSKNLKKKSFATQQILGGLQTKMDDILRGSKILRTYGAKSFILNHFSKQNDDHYRKNNAVLRKRDLASPISELLGVVLVIILIYYGALLVLDSEMKPETFFAFIFAFYNVIDPAKTLSTAYYNIQKGLASLDRITEVIRIGGVALDGNHTKDISPDWKELSISNVSYAFDDNKVLSDLDMSINRGQSVAIVGKSGEGKSTILDLILRFLSPNKGTIALDGIDISKLPKDAYRSLYSLVTQEPMLFNLSVEDNIKLGRKGVNESLEEATSLSRSAEFIKEKSEGLREIVGDMGMKYSMGERQRLTIARAMYDERPILIVDEATTALDAKAESGVLNALEGAMKGKTTIIISHKFKLLKNVDHIYVINNGKVVSSGTHANLLAQDGLYKELLSYQ